MSKTTNDHLYRVTYNGYTVEFFENIEAVNAWIENKLNKKLNPQMIASERISPFATVRIYRYYTLYSEMFLIELVNFID